MKKQGFALLSKKRLLEISASGGKKAHELGVCHRWDSKEATKASIKAIEARGQVLKTKKKKTWKPSFTR